MKIASIHKAHDDDHTASRRKDLGVDFGKYTSKASPPAGKPDSRPAHHGRPQSSKK